MARLFGDLDASVLVADQYVDVDTLGSSISTCFRLARDGRYSESQRGSFYAKGVALREQWKVLLGEAFDAGTPDLVKANATIKAVNASLAETLRDINKAADTIQQLGTLVAQLTKLIEIVGTLTA